MYACALPVGRPSKRAIKRANLVEVVILKDGVMSGGFARAIGEVVWMTENYAKWYKDRGEIAQLD